ncbi:hypothetical protein [Jiangella rhizosphaerae]|uniref:Heavy-metal-associated domain-containing protein n=1 Tax=Jiangella rhizosphaerae TaxID=2293569 RepID=A0A418KN34_9ACTN|nr:hypothetical protein [Jiangella rhizosphaerae]RIQ20317.1 hypothetical protein DY240_18370 [Jiangella rhizosphaerae]
MNAPAKLGVYALCLAGAFGLAAGAGRVVGPIGEDDTASATAESEESGMAGHDDEAAGSPEEDGGHAEEDGGHGEEAGDAAHLPGGLMVSDHGYTFALTADTLPAGADRPVSFVIDGPDGVVTEFDVEHEQELHLIAVRRDLTGYQHVHPVRAADGTWSVPLDLTPGEWKLFADFSTHGEAVTLGTDLSVPGDYQPAPLPAAGTTAQVDGYTVTLDGELHPGEESKLTLSVSRDGVPVTDLEPYLGAYGHLVALRDGDLAYLHVHPEGEPGDGVTPSGPDVSFFATAASVADYRLFFDFEHDGVVRTAEFTVTAEDDAHEEDR